MLSYSFALTIASIILIVASAILLAVVTIVFQICRHFVLVLFKTDIQPPKSNKTLKRLPEIIPFQIELWAIKTVNKLVNSKRSPARKRRSR